ncbi:ribosylnicotinamide kinase [Cladophialophora chaetospira]|uniref:Ribosylnicotinamide kinase n=1 Tax=Cladophialophora chaetospira TaxID=386627 RepID=A0AA38X870_9EURO|nr:ribosylnicotinamide kinase [Cladophialophora chaetospira]
MERLAAITRRQHSESSSTGAEEGRAPAEASLETIIIGLSGPSSSGKTTLARLLREIFNLRIGGLKVSLAILHQDDSYKTDKDIPVLSVTSNEFGTRELQDWDCVDSLDLPLFEHTLRYLHDHGSLPPDSVSKEDENSVGESHVSSEDVEEWKTKVKSWLDDRGQAGKQESKLEEKQIRIYIVDGFLLYPPAPSSSQANTYPHTQEGLNHLHGLIQKFLQPKLFIPSTRQQTLTRRAARSGYVTLEGFWTDPPGYVEDVVWPNYILYHSWMYKDGNVDGEEFDDKVCESQGLKVCPGGGQWKMPEVLEWAVQQVKESIEARV